MISQLSGAVFLVGILAGAVAGTVYFAALALSIRQVLRRQQATALLLLSAVLRIALLLWAGLMIARLGTVAVTGFGIAFLVVRQMIVMLVRPTLRSGSEQ